MGKYYAVDEVKQNGTLIHAHERDQVLRRLRSFGAQGVAVMVLDNGVRQMAVDVTRPAEYESFYQQYSQGWWLSYELYECHPPVSEATN